MAKQDLTPLVIRAQAGDQDALNDLLGTCYQDLYYYAYQTVKNEDLAADITQESCMEIITTLDKLREPGAFSVWARRITYHQCTRYFRQTREITVEENEDGETIFDRLPDESQGSLPEQVQEDKEFRKIMHEMLDSLSPEQRGALLLYYYEKLSVGQIAQIQGVSEGTVKSRLNYGRKAVKGKVEEYERKTGVRLHSFAPLPLLLLFLFGRGKTQVAAESAEVLAQLGQNVGAALGGGTAGAASAATAGAAGTAAGGAAAAGMSLGAKIVAGVLAATLAIGAAVGGGIAIKNAGNTGSQASDQLLDGQDFDPENPDALGALFGTWYGDDYLLNEADVMTLNRDGTLVYRDNTYYLCQWQTIDHPWAEELPPELVFGPCYRISISPYPPNNPSFGSTISYYLDLISGGEDSYSAKLQVLTEDRREPGQSSLYCIDYFYNYIPQPMDWAVDMTELEPLLGRWEQIPQFTEENSIYLNADGTALIQDQTYYISNIIHAYTADEELSKDFYITLSDGPSDLFDTVYSLDFQHCEDGTYLASLNKVATGTEAFQLIAQYYRVDDYAGYDKVLLTPENLANYICIVDSYTPIWDDRDQIVALEQYARIYFYDRLGYASYFSGDIHYEAVYREERHDANGTFISGSEEMGPVAGSFPSVLCSATGMLPVFDDNGLFQGTTYGPAIFIQKIDTTQTYTTTPTTYTITGGDNIQGCVFVPKQ